MNQDEYTTPSRKAPAKQKEPPTEVDGSCPRVEDDPSGISLLKLLRVSEVLLLERAEPQTLPGTCTANWNFTYLDNGNVNFPDNKKYSRSKPTIIRIPPTTLMPIRLTLLFFIILFAKTNSSAPTTIIKTDINGYMSFLLSNSELLNQAEYTTPSRKAPAKQKEPPTEVDGSFHEWTVQDSNL